jgi:hypothetical protein
MSIYGGCEGHQRVYRNDSTGGLFRRMETGSSKPDLKAISSH